MSIRSGHRAHGLDTHIHIYIYIYIHIFGEYKFYFMTLLLFSNPSSHVSVHVFVFRGGKLCLNKEGRV